jgi:hypothetical protein
LPPGRPDGRSRRGLGHPGSRPLFITTGVVLCHPSKLPELRRLRADGPIEVVRELCSADVDGARQSLALRGVGRLNDPRHGTRSKTGEKPTNPAGATDPNRSMTRIRLDLGGGLRGEIVVAPRRARVQWTRLGSARASRTRKLTFAHRASMLDGICRAVERWTRHARIAAGDEPFADKGRCRDRAGRRVPHEAISQLFE